MRVLVVTVQAPFVRGGAEAHAENLRDALRAEGHQADLVAIPFKWYPPERILDQMLACRLLDLSESDGVRVDRIIGLKFPAYLIPHDNKVLWILHQHRPAYDLWDHELGDLVHYPNGQAVRDAIRVADRELIPEARAVFANSGNVARRLKQYCDIESTPLYHPPPGADQYYDADPEQYLYFPSRITPNKRQRLVVEALALTRHPVRVYFSSATDHSTYADQTRERALELGLQGRVELLGGSSEDEKRWLYAHARGVVFPPVDEDYGYITLEGMLSSKPIVTCTDSGGPLEFVQHGVNGLVVEPTPDAMAEALDRIWEDQDRAIEMGRAGRDLYATLGISWHAVVGQLLA